MADHRGAVREDPDDVGAAPDLPRTLFRFRRTDDFYQRPILAAHARLALVLAAARSLATSDGCSRRLIHDLLLVLAAARSLATSGRSTHLVEQAALASAPFLVAGKPVLLRLSCSFCTRFWLVWHAL